MAERKTASKRPPFTVERAAPNSAIVTVDVPKRSGWEQWFLISSDRHHDNPHTRQDLELKHLHQARDRDAGIIDNGDLFCAMQGKYDKRSDKSELRDEHKSGQYLDRLVETAAQFYAPFAPWWIIMGVGNHETAIRKRHETDLTQRLVGILNQEEHGGRIVAGGYTNWIRLRFERCHRVVNATLIWMIHGYAGGGPVTKDLIQLNRQMVYVRDADVVVSGHTHDSWAVPIETAGCDQYGRPYQKRVWALKAPTYKDEYGGGEGGFHIETGKPPKPLGAWWLRFFYENDEVKYQVICAE